jgi:hypothetical protein
MAQNALGRVANFATSATTTATPVSLKGSSGVTIICIGATTGNVTIQQLTAASGGTAVNYDGSDSSHGDGITRYYTWASGVWTKHTQAAAATAAMVTGGLLVIEIEAMQLTHGYSYVSASHSSASFVYMTHDLTVQRAPANLASNIA